MDPFEMLAYAAKGKVLVYMDDKTSQMEPAYLRTHAIGIFSDMEYARNICQRLQARERARNGRADTRYILLTRGEEDACSEDLTEEQVDTIRDRIEGKITKPPSPD